MVEIPIKYDKILDVRAREAILRILYDGEKRSAYAIAERIDMHKTLPTVIDHLKKLEKVGYIKSEDTTVGNRIRKHYWITDKGKKALIDFLKTIAKDIKMNKEVTDTFTTFLTKK